jgi:hypothetical protein
MLGSAYLLIVATVAPTLALTLHEGKRISPREESPSPDRTLCLRRIPERHSPIERLTCGCGMNRPARRRKRSAGVEVEGGQIIDRFGTLVSIQVNI